MKRAPFLALALLAACGEPANEAPPTPETPISALPTPTSSTPHPAPESLVGEYRVAGIDSAELNAAYGIALSITEATVSFEPRCPAYAWSYAYRDGGFDIVTRQEAGHLPEPSCVAPSDAIQRQLTSALEAVNRARRTPANGVELSGNGRSVLLFSQ